ncbi:competence type IV pilus major pilin ComGC [Chungangia koreensis]|uniref:Competence type IV pilus major pilin ComGC n=1 Tax=Chungangia koreensis TaxID=752657 RepID=A0ABV8X5R8_9LACT
MNRKLGEEGFTLIEMMIVLLVISVLILIAIPNVTKHSETIDARGCEAYIKMLEGQVEAYKVDKKKTPTSIELSGYIRNDENISVNNLECPNGEKLEIKDGKVIKVKDTPIENT